MYMQLCNPALRPCQLICLKYTTEAAADLIPYGAER
jgi:hypothetical protein